ncbi:MAG: YdcF family protein [Hyphomicrobiaceae bacterium]
MRYAFANIVWFLAQPSSLIWLTLAVGLILRRIPRYEQRGRRLAFAGAALLLLVGLSPMANVLMLTLEQSFAGSSAKAADITGIIVLGGGEDGRISSARDQLTLNEGGERISQAVVLARQYPNARLIFTGGAGAVLREAQPGGDMVVKFWREAGIDPARITLEGNSLTTYENAQFTRDLLQPKPGQTWLLVTSAFHMPRSMGLFRKAGFNVVAHPVDYRTKDGSDVWRMFNSIPRGLQRFDEATREWTSLLAHRLLGRTDALLPGP